MKKTKRTVRLRRLFVLLLVVAVFIVLIRICVGALSSTKEPDPEPAPTALASVTTDRLSVATSALSPTRTPATKPTATPAPCPVTDDEIIMLAKTLYAESEVLKWYGDNFGMSYKARQAAVAWCALNRVDDGYWGDSLADVLGAPYQFAYSADGEVTDYMLALAEDVVDRWWREKQGETNVGRTLPAGYLYFHGDGKENYFRLDFKDNGQYWNWSLADPYKT